LKDLNAGRVQDEVANFKTNVSKVRNGLAEYPELQQISKDILLIIGSLKDPMRLLEVMCNKAMCPRHWLKVNIFMKH
jgi:hypothetical protein